MHTTGHCGHVRKTDMETCPHKVQSCGGDNIYTSNYNVISVNNKRISYRL